MTGNRTFYFRICLVVFNDFRDLQHEKGYNCYDGPLIILESLNSAFKLKQNNFNQMPTSKGEYGYDNGVFHCFDNRLITISFF